MSAVNAPPLATSPPVATFGGNTLGLKRLHPVADAAGCVVDTTTGAYKGARGYTPGFIEPYVKKTEDLVHGYTAPVYTYVQDGSTQVLKAADSQVDSVITSANDGVKQAKDLHKENLTHYDKGKKEYGKWVHDRVDYAKEVLNPKPYYNKTSSAVQSAGAKAWEFTDPDVAVDTAYDVGAKVASFGPVAKVLSISEPVTNFYSAKYFQLHNFATGTPLYKKVYDTGYNTSTSALKATQDTALYKKGKSSLYPYVASYADPIYDKWANSKYLNKLSKHFEPK